MVDLVDRRILGLIRPLDAVTGRPIDRALAVSGAGLGLMRTRSGGYAITSARGLEGHAGVFDRPPGVPVAGSLPFTVTIDDPAHGYLPRTAAIALPRAFDPALNIRDLQTPIDVAMAPSAARLPGPGAAAVLAVVTDQTGAPVRGALVEILPEGGGPRLAWAVTHDRGEALAAVPFLSAFRTIENDPDDEDDDRIVTNETPVTVRATADPARPWPVDPDVLAAGGAGLRTALFTPLALVPGRTGLARLTLALG